MGLGKDDENKGDSKNIAKERLQFILVQDRIKLSPAEMDSMQEDLIEVITKYIEINEQEIDVRVEREDEMMALRANIPIKQRK